MAEYIKRETAVRAVMAAKWVDGSDGAMAMEIVMTTPAVDVAPVVHSYWEGYSCSQYMGTDECGEPKWRDGRFFVCHNYKCRRKTVIKSNYCPNCGAKMDGGASK